MKVTYTSTVHSVVNAAELFHSLINHGLNADLVRDINLDGKCLKVCMCGVLFAFLRSLLNTAFVQVGESNAPYARLCEGESSLFADTSCSLQTVLGCFSFCQGKNKEGLLTPVMSAKPVLRSILDVMSCLTGCSIACTMLLGLLLVCWSIYRGSRRTPTEFPWHYLI